MTSQLPPLQTGTVLLETGRPDDENQQSLLFREPVEVLWSHNSSDVPALLAELDERLAKGFHVAGYLDYEAGYAFEAFPEFESQSRPIAWFGVYKSAELWPVLQRDRSDPAADAHLSSVAFSLSREAYSEAFRQTKKHLYEGDVYQINLTGKLKFLHEGQVADLYTMLKQRQGVAYNALIVTDDELVISCSPELFFRKEGRRIWTRPMKGTIDRGRTPEEDHERSTRLAGDPKSQAENLMIVDLLRNDLSRIAEQGSVVTTDLFATERYETVIQLTSTVEAELLEDVGYADIFAALFPCGSVTGAPKIRAMQIIQDIEPEPRGIYTGAIGYASPDGHGAFNVAIRTLSLSDGHGEMGTGGGIVWDSNEQDEFDECLLKARFLTETEPSFDLIETLSFRGSFERLDRHMARLLASAGYFGFAVDPRVILARLNEAVETKTLVEQLRVRVVLSRNGSVEVVVSQVDQLKDDVPTVILSKKQIHTGNRLLYHKTTSRDLYNSEYDRIRQLGHLEVIFANEHGQIAEGSRSNVYIERNGTLITPPVSCGLLPGTVREELLERGEVAEEVFDAQALAEADRVYVSNAILGLQRVRLVR